MSSRKTDLFTTAIDSVITSLRWISYIVCAIVTLILVANVLGRFVLNEPILGTIELVEMSMIIIGCIAIPYAAVKKAHVRMDLITSRLSKRAQAVLGSIAFFLSAAISIIIFYRSTLVAIDYAKDMGQATALLLIPFAPFRLIIAFGFLLLSLKFISDIFHPLSTENDSAKGIDK